MIDQTSDNIIPIVLKQQPYSISSYSRKSILYLSTTKLDVHTVDSLHSNGGTIMINYVGERGGLRKMSVPSASSDLTSHQAHCIISSLMSIPILLSIMKM